VDASRTAASDTTQGSDSEGLLTGWRERVLGGVIGTSITMLIPAWLIHAWQAGHGVVGAASGLWLVLASIVALSALGLWRAPYKLRAGLLVVVGVGVLGVTLLTEGFAPAQCLLVCMLVTVCSLLYSTRAAAWVLGATMSAMALAAWLYSDGQLTAVPPDHVDVTQPMNWLRVGLYTAFASATLSVASGYLLGQLRRTLQARNTLVAQLSAEVAERERALRELERTQAQLLQAQKLEAIGQLAAGIAHDFNNTLSIVSLEAGLLARQQSSSQIKRSAEALLDAAHRGKQLTQQLLLFSRPSGPRTQRSIDGAQVFEECVGALRRLLPSEITFEIDITAGPLGLNLQASELQQIVLNLGINARDAMSRGGTLRLALERRSLDEPAAVALGLAAGAYVLLSCRDDGCGMSSATLLRIFEPFFTTKGPGRGTGLGLTNVWNIAKRAGGHVTVHSTPGSGTTFVVYLPLCAAPAQTTVETAKHDGWAGHETVLVVEDDLRIRALLVATLADAGYRVLDAPDADAALALEARHQGPIDVVCTDVVMPGRQARDLLAELHARRPLAGILVCSGYSEDEQIHRGIHSGEFSHLSKPFTRGELLAAIRAAALQGRAHSAQA
jgi:signal transduction histidine kinase/ActR/RegA family two-component response regulator